MAASMRRPKADAVPSTASTTARRAGSLAARPRDRLRATARRAATFAPRIAGTATEGPRRTRMAASARARAAAAQAARRATAAAFQARRITTTAIPRGARRRRKRWPHAPRPEGPDALQRTQPAGVSSASVEPRRTRCAGRSAGPVTAGSTQVRTPAGCMAAEAADATSLAPPALRGTEVSLGRLGTGARTAIGGTDSAVRLSKPKGTVRRRGRRQRCTPSCSLNVTAPWRVTTMAVSATDHCSRRGESP